MSNFYKHPPIPIFVLGQYVVQKYEEPKKPYMVVGIFVEKPKRISYELEPVTSKGDRLREDVQTEIVPEQYIQSVEFCGEPKGFHSK